MVEWVTFSLYGVMREYRPVNKRYVGAVKDSGGLAVFTGGRSRARPLKSAQ